MKTKITFKSLLIITCLLLQINAYAQDVPPITLHVDKAGTLSTLIAANRKYEITDLTLTGNLNGTDILFLRDMAGRNSSGNVTNGKLSKLNLTDANITSIGDRAFEECRRLTNITIPNSITLIGDRAFSGCTGLTNITIPNSVTWIGDFAFSDCTGLTNVIIGNSVNTMISSIAFRGCTGLKEFIVSEQNQKYSSIEGVLLNKEKTTIINCPMGKQGSYVIPNSVITVESSAFHGCTGLTNVTIPNSVTSIGGSAFRGCTGLTSITIPNSVTTIETWAFRDCRRLTNITIPNSVTSIENGAFQGCSGLTEIHCKSPQPVTINASVFNNVNTTTCKLYVPKGSYTAYWLAPGWSDFKNIIEEDATAIQTINKDIASIHSISNGIYIDAKETASIVVYNLSGQTVYQNVINGSTEITLNKGVYIVRVNNESQKVIVK